MCKPLSSEVLTKYLIKRHLPKWTAFFVKYAEVQDDQFGKSHFNWQVDNVNYNVLRTGCFPFIKYHCTKNEFVNLELEDKFYRIIKVMNLGIPCLAYGVAGWYLARHVDHVETSRGIVALYFWYKETW